MKAVILAGGKGTRLKPYTTSFPKPLMPIGEKPILEILIENLKLFNVKDIFIATGHLSELIRAFFGDGEKYGVNIKYSIEDRPLGTAGPLKFFSNDIKEDYFVINGDTLTDLDYSEMINFHNRNKNIATIGTIQRNNHVDFGIVELNSNDNYKGWVEKPTLKYLVSMGVYIFSEKIFKFLPNDDSCFNLPSLIDVLFNNNQKIMGYRHTGYWLDIGRPEDYEKACSQFGEKHFT